MATDLGTNLAGVRLSNPTVLASGIWGTSARLLERAAAEGAGAVTTKSASVSPRTGHPNPIVVDCLEKGWVLNAVGLSNPGIEEKMKEIREFKRLTKTPIIASVFASTAREFGEAVELVDKAEPDAIELNESCPNVESEFGRPFCFDESNAAKAVEAAREKTKKPIFAKLSPDIPSIELIAKACVEAGADGITAVNTTGPGMAIDIERAAPVLANKFGGMSGPALKPIAVKCVYRIHAALPDVPIIGTGGVGSAEDAIELMMAGATAVGIGTAVMKDGAGVFGRVRDGMGNWMKEHGYSSARQLTGAAHGGRK